MDGGSQLELLPVINMSVESRLWLEQWANDGIRILSIGGECPTAEIRYHAEPDISLWVLSASCSTLHPVVQDSK
jgi:hypothetical protein